MDDRRFDALTRAFARGVSRRTAIKGLFGGVVGGVALTTRLNNVGAQGTPCDPLNVGSDCPLPDACTSATCVQGVGTEDFFCAYDGGCAEGTCQECDTLSGECISTCSACQVCDSGTCIDTCGACQVCDSGTCIDTCTNCQECEGGLCVDLDDGICCNGTWTPGGQCCTTDDCVLDAATFCSSVACIDFLCTNIPECPGGQLCCGLGEEGAFCAECCSDDDCLGCAVCNEVGQCSDPECCTDADCPDCMVCGLDGICAALVCPLGETCCEGHECVPEDECCKDFGDYCGILEVTASGGDSSDQLDCCDGLLCCENWNSQGSVCAQCCNDWDCGKGGVCDEGVCEYPVVCHHDWECPEHTCCCDDGSCSWHCCDHHHRPHPKPPKPPKPAPSGGPVTSLPDTGSGAAGETQTGLLGAAALGAAALFAAKKLRDDQAITSEPESPNAG